MTLLTANYYYICLTLFKLCTLYQNLDKDLQRSKHVGLINYSTATKINLTPDKKHCKYMLYLSVTSV